MKTPSVRLAALLLGVLALGSCDSADPSGTDPPVTPADITYNVSGMTADQTDATGYPQARTLSFRNSETNARLGLTNSTNCAGREILLLEINFGDGFAVTGSTNSGAGFRWGSGSYLKYAERVNPSMIKTARIEGTAAVSGNFPNAIVIDQDVQRLYNNFVRRDFVCPSI